MSALKAIKGNLIDASNNLKNWGSGDPCTSNWTGIYCDKIPSDSYLHVTEMYDQFSTLFVTSTRVLSLDSISLPLFVFRSLTKFSYNISLVFRNQRYTKRFLKHKYMHITFINRMYLV